ncbi:hypothetical protein B5V89_17235 [Heyndrickxia sporothermodurans]|uniref:hypothetical protein n=1 Tax=Heyndrickxia sporothermodurans TaxID=46224 RepID=UPI000D3B76F9|nr:hypothetical protein [Heyndrickxia sporothermodurans]PTY76696.1 hypothetical protein B5V89_17235 [Heyndrickxia sporothermodurans]
MPISYEVFMRHAEKVTKNATKINPTRPVLAGVFHHEDGSLVVTDSHRLYKAFGTHHNKDLGSVITPKGKKIEGNYPPVDRLMPYNDPQQEIVFEVGELLQAADILYHTGMVAREKVDIDFKDKTVAFIFAGVMMGSYTLSKPFKEPFSLNALYLLETMKLFKAAKCETVKVNFYGRNRPLLIEDETGDLKALILPIRRY